ncbi:LOW QUALITY PROTEIN: Retrovirus-related Pol Polyprotein [Phytophthora palmivora]|uniref:Retrovirus-related Pol Polyprotein n=1 Tax=Phytophthora palmivora TaxID=4796 RepID=A0A2P4YV16_9STRA|nr:LOW QUALITY PROTEIN: Retrovirus-related Pol Polyprotein [Phytophthora palmivora]
MAHKWGPEALVYMTYVQNRAPMVRLGNITPYEMVYKTQIKRPVWGSTCFAHFPAAPRKYKKMPALATKCRFLGMSEESKGHRLWDVYNNRLILFRDVLFDTTSVSNLVKRGFGQTEQALTTESAAREPPAAEETNTPTIESTEIVGADPLAQASIDAVETESPAQTATPAVGAKNKRRHAG